MQHQPITEMEYMLSALEKKQLREEIKTLTTQEQIANCLEAMPSLDMSEGSIFMRGFIAGSFLADHITDTSRIGMAQMLAFSDITDDEFHLAMLTISTLILRQRKRAKAYPKPRSITVPE